MFGDMTPSTAGNPGLLHYILADLFAKVAREPMGSLSVEMTCLEVYNEKLEDLLAPPAARKDASDRDSVNPFIIMADNMGKDVGSGVGLPTRRAALTKEEAFAFIWPAIQSRSVGDSHLNRGKSSRSHLLIQIVVVSGKKTCGRLNLVDLAGSERYSTEISVKANREGKNIRKSLLELNSMITLGKTCLIFVTLIGMDISSWTDHMIVRST
jgi:hypothetical protein